MSTALPQLKPARLEPGDTVALVSPGHAVFERQPFTVARESLEALGLQVRESPNLRARRGQYAGTAQQRADDLNAMFADDSVHGILAMNGGSGANHVLPLLDYAAIARKPKFFGGYSDMTSLINAVNRHTGLVTFHSPMGVSSWNRFNAEHWRRLVMDGEALTLANPTDTGELLAPRQHRISTLRGGRARGRIVGGNLAVLVSLAGSPYWPDFDGAVLVLEDINELIYRVDRMFTTLELSGALGRVAAVVLGGFTNCTPGEGYGSLTLDEVFDDWLLPLGVPVFAGASFGHIGQQLTLPLGLPVEVDADAGTIRLLEPAVV